MSATQPIAAVPTPAEHAAAAALCARHGVQPTEFTPERWLDLAVRAEPMGMPITYPADDWLLMGVLAERFPGTTFR